MCQPYIISKTMQSTTIVKLANYESEARILVLHPSTVLKSTRSAKKLILKPVKFSKESFSFATTLTKDDESTESYASK